MYRPTVRYDDVFREYVDSLFHATDLDRNQIIRAALFAAAHSKEFQNLLKPYKKKDVPVPSPLWKLEQHCFWLEQHPKLNRLIEDANDVNIKYGETVKNLEASCNSYGVSGGSERSRCIEQVERQSKNIFSEPIKIVNQGGIIFTIT
jgi:hypothetical protein